MPVKCETIKRFPVMTTTQVVDESAETLHDGSYTHTRSNEARISSKVDWLLSAAMLLKIHHEENVALAEFGPVDAEAEPVSHQAASLTKVNLLLLSSVRCFFLNSCWSLFPFS